VHRGELAGNQACAEATHFVYGYNLGAFALASASKLHGEVNGSYFGFGAGGSKTSTSSAEKKGGDIASCTGDSAKEVDTCKAPIRLTLREISDGTSDDAQAATAPDTDAAMNLAGKLQAQTEKEKQAEEHGKAAQSKLTARDGKGCLAELDQHDRLDPRPSGLSTAPTAGGWAFYAGVRAQCLMVAGQCNAGKQLQRRVLENTPNGAQMSGDMLDKLVEASAQQFCQGASMSPRDQMLSAINALRSKQAGMQRADSASCQQAVDTVGRLRETVKPQGDDDWQLKPDGIDAMLFSAGAGCFAKAGDCSGAWAVYRVAKDRWWNEGNHTVTGDRAAMLKDHFGRDVPACKGKGP
jgi:hypothetical protein